MSSPRVGGDQQWSPEKVGYRKEWKRSEVWSWISGKKEMLARTKHGKSEKQERLELKMRKIRKARHTEIKLGTQPDLWKSSMQ